MIQLGISPRGALALCRVAKARAFVNKRDFVTPEDVKASAGDVFAHRLPPPSHARPPPHPAPPPVAGHYGVGVTAVLTAGSDRLYEGIFVYAVDDYLVVLNITTLAEEGVGNIMNSFTAY